MASILPGSPPRETLLTAIANFENEAINQPKFNPEPKFVVDLGCGRRRDTRKLIQRGWSVLEIDAESTAIEILRRFPVTNPEVIQTQVIQFNALTLPANVHLK